jgi:selenocysteine lyase/cysteine desulfurase
MTGPTNVFPTDEGFWSGIRAQYGASDEFINLENGYFGIPALPVQRAHEEYNRLINREGALFMRTKYPQRLQQVVQRLARFAGVGENELVIVRNPTEAMNILIAGYPFRAGDEVLTGDQDYDSVNEALMMHAQRGRFRVLRVQVPFLPDSDEQIVALYERAITPHTRVIVLTHMLHKTGHLLPVAKIARMAQARGIDVMVDAAHSFAQVDFKLPELGSPFVGAHLHKWAGAPLGLGLLHVRHDRVADIAPLFGDVQLRADDINKLAHFGTTAAGAELAIEDALAFHERIGGRNKEARLRWLKDYWTSRVREFSRIRIMTPLTPGRSCTIASFRVEGMAASAVADYLYREHRIFTVATQVAGVDVVRVTPHLYTTTEHLDRLVAALEKFS